MARWNNREPLTRYEEVRIPSELSRFCRASLHPGDQLRASRRVGRRRCRQEKVRRSVPGKGRSHWVTVTGSSPGGPLNGGVSLLHGVVHVPLLHPNRDPLSKGLMLTDIGGSNHDDDTPLANPLVELRKK